MDFIVLPKLKPDELEPFIEFLYTAQLPKAKMNKHVYALSRATEKYRVSYLLKACERHLKDGISVSSVLDVFEATSARGSCMASVKKDALEFIVKNKGDIFFTANYETFAHKIQFTRAFAESKE